MHRALPMLRSISPDSDTAIAGASPVTLRRARPQPDRPIAVRGSLLGRRVPAAGTRVRTRGQGLVEFALVVPLMFLLAVAVGDFGRLFNAAVATESAAREAADYGAFLGSSAWASSLSPWTANDTEMRLRACTAMSGQADFENSAGTCTGNPTMSWRLEDANGTSPPAVDCGTLSGLVAPCRIHVTVTYTFRPLVAVPPIPGSLTLTRESWFAISDLTGS
jgi:Flp pilus assembly protein TadG